VTSQDKPKKCVIVINKSLPLGLMANSAAVLGVALGRLAVGGVGPDVPDASGVNHRGITTIPIAVLAASADELKAIAALARERPEIDLVDFTDAAQTSKSYPDYSAKLASRPTSELGYLAILLWGDKSTIAQLTSSLPLLR
jgi:hypothetical protein